MNWKKTTQGQGAYLLPLCVLALLGLLLLRVSTLENKLEDLERTSRKAGENMSQEINRIPNQIAYALEQQASIFAKVQTDIGTFDAETLTVPVTVSITPKSLGDDTQVALNHEGTTYPLIRQGAAFQATFNLPFWGSFSPSVSITTAGITQTEVADELDIYALQDLVFPLVDINFWTYGETEDENTGTFSFEGDLQLENYGKQTDIFYRKARLEVEVAGEVVHSEDISQEFLNAHNFDQAQTQEDWDKEQEATPIELENYAFQAEFPLPKDALSTLYLYLEDSLGLTHRYILYLHKGGSNSQPDLSSPQDTHAIYSPQGELLWSNMDISID